MKRGLSFSSSTPKNRKTDNDIPSTPNGVFQLNEDCLAEVFKYLPLKDVCRILQTDQRFRSPAMIRIRGEGVKQIDDKFLSQIPSDIREDYLMACGPRVSRIELKSSQFLTAIRHFRNLNELILRHVSFSDGDVPLTQLPESLKILEMDECVIVDEHVLRKWFGKIYATLTEFRIVERRAIHPEPTAYDWLEEFRNITRLRIVENVSEIALGKLFGQNKDNLRSLEIVLPSFNELRDIWGNIAPLNQLTELKLRNYSDRNSVPLASNLWPQLTSLTLSRVRYTNDIIDHLGCELSLNSLCIIDPFEKLKCSALTRFPNLRTLELTNKDSCFFDIETLSELDALQQVHFLVLNRTVLINFSDVLGIVENMPNLKKLTMDELYFIDTLFVGIEALIALEFRLKRALKIRHPSLEVQLSVTEYNYFGLD